MSKKSLFSRLRNRIQGKPTKPADPPQAFWVPEVKIERRGGVNSAEISTAQPRVADEHNHIQHDSINTIALREKMLNHLNLDELTTIAQAIDIDLTTLAGGKGRKAMSLLQSAQRSNQLPNVLSACQTVKPDVTWQ